MGNALRFFRVVRVHSRLTLALFMLLVACGVTLAISEPDAIAAATVPIVWFQMLAASTGYLPRLRSGHFDLLLTSGTSRVAAAVAHLGASVGPGAAALTVVLVAHVIRQGAQRSDGYASLVEPIVALVVTSALAWCVGLPFGRFIGGTAWCTGVVVLMLFAARYQPDLLARSSGEYAPSAWPVVVAVLVPVLMIEPPVPWLRAPWVLAAAACVGVLVVCIAVAALARADARLEVVE